MLIHRLFSGKMDFFNEIERRLKAYRAHLNAESKKLNKNDKPAKEDTVILAQKQSIVYALLTEREAMSRFLENIPQALVKNFKDGYLEGFLMEDRNRSAMVRAGLMLRAELKENIRACASITDAYDEAKQEAVYAAWRDASPEMCNKLKDLINIEAELRLARKAREMLGADSGAAGLTQEMFLTSKIDELKQDLQKLYGEIRDDRALQQVMPRQAAAESVAKRMVGALIGGDGDYNSDIYTNKVVNVMIALTRLEHMMGRNNVEQGKTVESALQKARWLNIQVVQTLPKDDMGLLNLLSTRRGHHNPLVWIANMVRKVFGYSPLTIGVTGNDELVRPIKAIRRHHHP